MGVDGFSMSNLGLHRDVTSAQLSNQAEQLAHKGSEFKIKDVATLSEKKGVKVKKENADGFHGSLKFNDNEEEEQTDEQNSKGSFSEKDFESRDPKEFSVKINPRTEMIELYNNKSKKIVETISAGDLMAMISKLDNASGVLVNRKI